MSLIKRAGYHIGRRGTALLFFAFLDLIYAINLFNPPYSAVANPAFTFLAQIMPTSLWGLIWASAGVACFIGAFVTQDRWAFAVAMALKTLWGSVFLFGWLVGLVERGWVSAAVWLAFAGWVFIISTWPESTPLPPQPPTPEEITHESG